MQKFRAVAGGLLSFLISMTGLQLLSYGATRNAILVSSGALFIATISYILEREKTKEVGFFNSRSAIFVVFCGLFAAGVLLSSLANI